jgi:AraC-like DNA-binding protein
MDSQYGDTIRRLYRGGIVEVGSFRCPPDHPLFRDSGPVHDFNVVFPRTSVWIRPEGQEPFFSSPAVSPLYNNGQRNERCRSAWEGAHSDWIAVTDAREMAEIAAEFDPAAADRWDRPLVFPWVPCPPRLYLRQRLLVRSLAAARPADPLRAEEEALAIFRGGWLAGACPDRRQRPRSRRVWDLYVAAREIIHRRYRDPLRLEDVAGPLRVSISSLCEEFRAGGATIHQVVMDLRLREALELVLDSGRDLTEVALELGFSSHSHFTAAFRRTYRATPSTLRRIRVWPQPRETHRVAV